MNNKINKEDKLSFELADRILRYEPDTGKFYWKDRDSTDYANWLHDGIESAKSFNKIWSGKEALRQTNDGGYKFGQIFKTQYKAHRVAWLLYYKEWPKGQIDHINGIKTDNRIENLRVVTNEKNNKNLGLRITNKSGYSGVNYDPSKRSTKKWRARLRHKGKKIHLGWFFTKEEAAEAIIKAKPLYGYTDRHGT